MENVIELKPKTKEITGYRLIFGYLGIFIFLTGIICLCPLIMLFFYPEDIEFAKCFLLPGVGAIFLGYFMQLLIKGRTKSRGNLSSQQGMVLIVLVWIVAILICSIPFVLTKKYNFTQAIFETTSGFSTTGLTVYQYDCGNIFLFYRTILLFFGGIGLVLIVTSAISDKYGLKIYTAEGHTDKLLPNLVKSARLIFAICLGSMVVGMFLFVACGMSWFDAINHSIAAYATGGFSTHPENIGYFNSVGVEVVAMLIMLLGTTNFAVQLNLLKGKFKKVAKHSEIRFALGMLVILIPIMLAVVGCSSVSSYTNNWAVSSRISVFHVVSAMSTTGFTNLSIAGAAAPLDFSLSGGFPVAASIIIIILMIIGGGIGSTAGAIKQYRVVVFGKSLFYSMRDKMLNRRIVKPESIYVLGERRTISSNDFKDCATFIFAYIITFVLGTFAFACYGYPIGDSAFEFASSIGGVGLTTGITSFGAPSGVLWISTIGMFLGRLEIIVIFLALYHVVHGIFAHKEEAPIN